LEQRLFFFLRFNEYEDRAVQNMGQLYCHTKPPSASRRVTAHRINDRWQSYWLQTIKRFAKMLIDRDLEKGNLLHISEN